MPFIKKNGAKSTQQPTEAHKIFVGRSSELHFFSEQILKPAEPTHNILSISGHGGVGKSTLLAKFIEDARADSCKDYCLIAVVDERQVTAAELMERFAEQLHIAGEFKKVLAHYKGLLGKQLLEQETIRRQDTVLSKAPDFAGAVVEGIPLVGGILRESVKMATGHIIHQYQSGSQLKQLERPIDPISMLTRTFVEELNRLADAKVTLSGTGGKRERRIVLFFDTFEQLAAEATPWLLDHFLVEGISNNVVLVIAGRTAIERSAQDGPRGWLPYLDSRIIHSIRLNSFTQEETCAYLEQRGITDAERQQTIWRLSRGLPLYLSLLTYNPQGEVDPTADVVENFLQWIPAHDEVKRRLALDAALFSRPFNQDDLAAFAYLPEHDRAALYSWLCKQPFVRHSPQGGRHSYHELAQDLFCRHLYQLSPNRCHTTRQALAEHYQHLLEKCVAEEGEKAYDTDEWLELTLALADQYLLLPGNTHNSQAIEQFLNAYEHTKQVSEIVRPLHEAFQEQVGQPISPSTHALAKQLLHYIEAERLSQEFLTATNYLLEQVSSASSFSPAVLASIYHKRGITYRLLDQYQRAIEDFDRALALNPQDARLYGSRGIAYSFSEDYQQALRDFNHSLTLDPQSAWTYASRGKTYFLLKDYPRALQDFNQALTLNPTYAWAYANRGKTYFLLKEFAKAVEDFDRALALGPNYTWAYAKRGETFRLLNEYHRAIADYDRAIALDPNYAWTYAERGRVYRTVKDYPRAIADYDLALTLDPQYAWAYSGRAETYRLLHEYQQAIRDFDQAITYIPNDAWAYRHRGLTYLALKEHEQALQDFDHAIQLTPRYFKTYLYRGVTHLHLQHLTAAQADFQHADEQNPADIRARWRAMWCVLCQQQEQPSGTDCSEQLEEIATIDPEHYVAHLCRGLARWLEGSFELALAEVEQSIALQPEMWDGYFWRAMAYLSLGWEMEALEVLEQAQQMGLPRSLLAPLQWLAQDKPEFYEHYLQPMIS